MSPDFFKFARYVESVFSGFTEECLIFEVKPKDAGVVVCTGRAIAIFPTGIVPERAPVVAKAFEELLKVWFVERSMRWEFRIAVRECDKTGVVMELFFEDHSECPLS